MNYTIFDEILVEIQFYILFFFFRTSHPILVVLHKREYFPKIPVKL